jgi:hypothetical protein
MKLIELYSWAGLIVVATILSVCVSLGRPDDRVNSYGWTSLCETNGTVIVTHQDVARIYSWQTFCGEVIISCHAKALSEYLPSEDAL